MSKERKNQNLFLVLLNVTTFSFLICLSFMLLLYSPQDLPAITSIIHYLIVHFSWAATDNINKDYLVQIRRWLYLHCYYPNLIFSSEINATETWQIKITWSKKPLTYIWTRSYILKLTLSGSSTQLGIFVPKGFICSITILESKKCKRALT